MTEKRDDIRELYATVEPHPPFVVQRALWLLDNAAEGSIDPATWRGAFTRGLIDCLTEDYDHFEKQYARPIEFRDPTLDEPPAIEWKTADTNHYFNRSRGVIVPLFLVTLRVRLQRLFIKDDPMSPLPVVVEPPSSAPPRDAVASSTAQPPVEPRDGDGWEDAVALQGVRVTYDGYLLTTHWELLRAERLTGVCERCHRQKRTQLHHVTYARLGAEQPTDTLELCDACHRRAHPRQLKLAA